MSRCGPKPRNNLRVRKREHLIDTSKHAVAKCKSSLKCTRCHQVASEKEANHWLQTECRPTSNKADPRAARSTGKSIQIGSAVIHETHSPTWAALIGLWCCERCGMTGRLCLRALAKPCCNSMGRSGRQSLAIISKGLLPGDSEEARQSNAGRIKRKRSRSAPSMGMDMDVHSIPIVFERLGHFDPSLTPNKQTNSNSNNSNNSNSNNNNTTYCYYYYYWFSSLSAGLAAYRLL